jgi:hypothetical protein
MHYARIKNQSAINNQSINPSNQFIGINNQWAIAFLINAQAFSPAKIAPLPFALDNQPHTSILVDSS